ncbi:MAG: tRNA (adenosine(37)-N6)-threonylcarbamoyltransferase complex dimerization subunit type 1 TsaB [Alphaproteobacteria bacterium]|nr:tRNA (adenosine(37)-N6)-threonylcarbamoyltransferase complex dimerization subunit type 1 TsaB [Alphaproteobacteria bacterium]MCD8571301.1 tRNA (adenosine(37)-N6)-threonylcarbamoyltransferase complex dimerization subunit type 1 TsaB [Alphaproteobacteria bacterium]
MNGPHTIFALDTSLSRCSVGVFCKETKRIVSKHMDMDRGHAEALIPLVEEVLAEAGLTFADLDAIATPIGPGAFTGLRIGLSAAKSFGLSLDIPVLGLESFAVLVRQYMARQDEKLPCDTLGVLIETRRSDFYVRLFDNTGNAVSEPEALEASDVVSQFAVRPICWIGDACSRFQEVVGADMPSTFTFADEKHMEPQTMIEMVQEMLAQGGCMQKYSDAGLAPIYLRGADVSQPKTVPRLIS